MTGKVKDEEPVARGMMPYVLLLIFVLFVFGGCAGTEAPKPAVDRVGTVPSEKTEAQLLAELDKRFENAQVHYELARVYHRSATWNKAEYHYNVALGFEPWNKAAQAGMVKMFADRGDATKAEQLANGYIRQAAVAVAEMLRLGWEFEKLGMDDYALRSFRQAVTAAPDSAEANKLIAAARIETGQWPRPVN